MFIIETFPFHIVLLGFIGIFPLVPTISLGMVLWTLCSVTMNPWCDAVSSHKHNRSPGQNVEISKVSPELVVAFRSEIIDFSFDRDICMVLFFSMLV